MVGQLQFFPSCIKLELYSQCSQLIVIVFNSRTYHFGKFFRFPRGNLPEAVPRYQICHWKIVFTNLIHNMCLQRVLYILELSFGRNSLWHCVDSIMEAHFFVKYFLIQFLRRITKSINVSTLNDYGSGCLCDCFHRITSTAYALTVVSSNMKIETLLNILLPLILIDCVMYLTIHVRLK